MKTKIVRLLLTLFLFAVLGSVSAQVPERPNPPRLVNDFAGLFSSGQQQQLEQVLVEFNDSTSNQILIVTVKDLGGQEKSEFAYQIGRTWGVGQKKLNNGLVILIKPRTDTKGEAFIATGYGLEGPLPDAICKRIVENEMIPHFRQKDYFGGVVQALRVIIPIAKGEYKYPMEKKKGSSGYGGLLVLIVFFVFFIVISRKNRNNGNFSSSGAGGGSDLWSMLFLASLFGRSNNGGGSWGNFSGGGNDSGGSDFGGFGGGDFGGGGAGGSW
ncbi:MAG: TPM domain-containing protein [Bacteroidales bacterium]